MGNGHPGLGLASGKYHFMHDGPGEPGTHCHYLLVGLSTLPGTHMRLRDFLLFQPDFLQESTPLVHPWHEPPFQAPSAP